MVDKVEIKNVENNPTLEEQDKALQEAQKAPSEKPSETSETRPEWLPEKFRMPWLTISVLPQIPAGVQTSVTST